MDRARKRRIRLFVALSVAVTMSVALIYTSFTSASETRTPSQLIAQAKPGKTYQLTGKVVAGSIKRSGDTVSFRVRDRDGTNSVMVTYSGVVPDPFREGREVIVDVRKHGEIFEGERDSLVTKCPSKFNNESTTAASGS